MWKRIWSKDGRILKVFLDKNNSQSFGCLWNRMVETKALDKIFFFCNSYQLLENINYRYCALLHNDNFFSYGKLQRLRGKQRWNFWKKENSMIEPSLLITSMLLTTKRIYLIFSYLFFCEGRCYKVS